MSEAGVEKKKPDLFTTVNMMRQPRMYLLGPIFAANGLVSALVSAVFTKDVILPNLGECNVGYVMAANSAASALISINIGRCSDQFGRPAVMAFAVVSIVAVLAVLRFHPPTGSLGIYNLGVLIGIGMAALRTPLSAQLSASYNDDIEAAFAASEMYSNIAASAGFLFAGSMPFNTQVAPSALSPSIQGLHAIKRWFGSSSSCG